MKEEGDGRQAKLGLDSFTHFPKQRARSFLLSPSAFPSSLSGFRCPDKLLNVYSLSARR